MNIVETWLEDLSRVLGEKPLATREVRLGVFYTAVQLAGGQVGVAFTPRERMDKVCCPQSAAAGLAVGDLAGKNAWDLARYALSTVALQRAVGVAVLNALTSLARESHGVPGGRLFIGVDALEAAGVQPDDRVALVGAFVPYIKALKNRVASLCVVDKHPKAMKPQELPLWRPPEQAVETLAQASVVLITGSALVEGGLDELLAAAGRARKVVLAGPTAPLWPPPFFARGVHVLGGIQVMDNVKMLQLVSEGGGGHSFGAAAQKVVLIRET